MSDWDSSDFMNMEDGQDPPTVVTKKGKPMQITVLSVSKTQHMTKTNKPYFQLEIAYKGDDGQVKGKKLMPFGSTKPAFDVLEKGLSGEVYDITLVKEGEYWSWTTAKKSDGVSASSASSSPVNAGGYSSTPAAAGKVVGSNYETSAERAAKQVFIVRQSSIANAVSTLTPGAKGALLAKDVLVVAKLYEEYVFAKEAPVAVSPVRAGPTSLDDFESDIPL